MESESNIPRTSIPATMFSEASLALDFGAPDMIRKPSATSPIPVRSNVSPTSSWKAVGGPAAFTGSFSNSSSESPDFGLFRRSSAANVGGYIGRELDGDVRGPTPSVGSGSVPASGNWGGSGMSWKSPNIWNEQNVIRTSPNKANAYRPENLSGILPITEEPIAQYRQQRSFSIAYGQHGADFLEDLDEKERQRQTLEALGEELTEEEYEDIFKFRHRSKSSFGTYHFPPQHTTLNDVIPAPPGFEKERNNKVHGLHSIWGQQPVDAISVNRRRSIANPVSMWDKNIGADPAAAGIGAYTHALNAERLDRLNQHRRYSLALSSSENQFPDPLHEAQVNNRTNLDDGTMGGRRHSVALSNPYMNNAQADKMLSETLESIEIDDTAPMGAVGTSAKQSDEYAETQSNHQRSYSDLGKGVPLNTLPRQRPLYIVEFKAGRTDIYYTAENSSLVCRVGDLVIVEADRGKDLGKVINDSVTPKQLELLQQNQAGDSGSGDSRLGNKEIQPKLIYHIAQPSEIAQLAAKSQDEAKAMLVCQTKVRQKKLPMEVMDAEYQWDRRKLTFYFIAQRRIDFRELVRDLFKIYKTRIWMCAMNTNPITSLLRSAESPSQSVADADKE